MQRFYLVAVVVCAVLVLSTAKTPRYNSADLVQCIQKCEDKSIITGPHVDNWQLFCGTDNVTHNITWMAPVSTNDPFWPYSTVQMCLFSTCNLAPINPNTCECPSDCFSSFGQGSCVNGQCACAQGWRGRDCSLPLCPDNPCSAHGKCDAASNVCVCDPAWTGHLCQSPVTHLPVLPWGDLFPNPPFYTDRDQYKDDHPVFNLSVIAVIKMTITPDDLAALYLPKNVRAPTWYNVSMSFNNGYIDQAWDNVGVRLRGNVGRMMPKRGLRFDLSQFVDGRTFFGLSSISVDSEHTNPTQMNHIITGEMFRLMGIPGNRMSFAQVFVNDAYFGIYTLAEEMDKTWVGAHWDKHKGNLYTLGVSQYLGTASRMNVSVVQARGDGDWADYVNFFNILNAEDFSVKALNKVFNIDRWIRATVVEIFVDYGDGYIWNGNNYALYNNPATGQFDWGNRDYEHSMFDDVKRGILDDYCNVTRNSPRLWMRLLADTKLRQSYINYFKLFLSTLFTVENRAQLLTRIGEYGAVMSAQLAHDTYFFLEGGRTGALAQQWVNNTQDWIVQRSEIVAKMLNMTLPPAHDNAIDN